MESVAIRQRGGYDFAAHYDHLCALNNTCPLPAVKAHLAQQQLDINADRVRYVMCTAVSVVWRCCSFLLSNIFAVYFVGFCLQSFIFHSFLQQELYMLWQIHLSVSVCLSVALRYCVKTREHRGMRSLPSDSPMSLAF